MHISNQHPTSNLMINPSMVPFIRPLNHRIEQRLQQLQASLEYHINEKGKMAQEVLKLTGMMQKLEQSQRDLSKDKESEHAQVAMVKNQYEAEVQKNF